MLEGGYIGDMGIGVGSKGLGFGFGVDTVGLFAGVAGVIVFLLLVVLLLCSFVSFNVCDETPFWVV